MRTLDYTDGWHPTVNPSARMPIHHFRFVELLGHSDGVLNEMPRHFGGSTLRVLRIHGHRAKVVELPGTLVWTPWWLPADDPWAVGLIAGIYRKALNSEIPTSVERAVFGRVVEEFKMECASSESTIGEALWRVMNRLHRDIVPGLPRISLTSLTRSPIRYTLADALTCIPGGPVGALSRWATAEKTSILPMVAVATDLDGRPLRIRLHARAMSLDTELLPCDPATERAPGKPVPITGEGLIDLLRAGRMIPGSRLVALAEAALCDQGWNVRHFGNTYGHIVQAGHLLEVPQSVDIPCCPDEDDSWHYADLTADHLKSMQRYPLHLLDVAARVSETQLHIGELIDTSLTIGGPVHLKVQENLDETICYRGT